MIDVVVPFHRNSDVENLASWEMESFKEFSFILVHDAFMEGCIGDCAKKFELVSNIKTTCGQFGAPGLARNAGMALSTSDWIMFVDSDDTPKFESIAKVQKIATKEGHNILMGNFKEIDRQGKVTFYDDILQFNYWRHLANRPGLWRFAFSKSLLKGITFTTHRWGEDQLFLLKVFSKSNVSLCVVNECIYEYKKYGAGQVTNESSFIFDLVNILELETCQFSQVNKEQFNELYDFFTTRQVLTIVKQLGIRAPKMLILKTLLVPFSMKRLARKMNYALSITMSRMFNKS